MSASATLAYLLLGHILADFAFQSSKMVQNKHQSRVLLRHGGIVFVTHFVVMLPLMSFEAAVGILVIAVSHLGIDRAKQRIQARTERRLWPFLADQAAHVAVIVVVAWFLDAAAVFLWPNLAADAALLTTEVLAVAALVFNVHGGATIVRFTLGEVGAEAATPDGRGFAIGVLERWLVLLLAMAGQWAAVGLVLAAKSLARFEQLKDRDFAEYYLVGTLTSVLVAVLSALVVLGTI